MKKESSLLSTQAEPTNTTLCANIKQYYIKTTTTTTTQTPLDSHKTFPIEFSFACLSRLLLFGTLDNTTSVINARPSMDFPSFFQHYLFAVIPRSNTGYQIPFVCHIFGCFLSRRDKKWRKRLRRTLTLTFHRDLRIKGGSKFLASNSLPQGHMRSFGGASNPEPAPEK